MKRLVSVVTICRNMRDDLRLTADSVLRQRGVDLEFHIVDGASADGTVEVIRAIEAECRAAGVPLRWSSEPDGGIYDAMNKGVARATGEWVVFMNAGDRFAHDSALAELLKSPAAEGADLVYGSTIVERDFGSLTVRPRPLAFLRRKMAFCHQSMAVRTALMREHPFDTRFRVCADFEFVHWCHASGKILREVDTTVAIFDGAKGNSRKQRLRLDRECAAITGRDREVSWRLRHGLKVIEAGFNSLYRTFVPKSVTSALRQWVYRRKQGR